MQGTKVNQVKEAFNGNYIRYDFSEEASQQRRSAYSASFDDWAHSKVKIIRSALETEAKLTMREWPRKGGDEMAIVIKWDNDGVFEALWG